MEFDFHSYNKRLQQISVPVGALKQPWWPRWLAYAETAVDQRGGTPDAANHLQEWAERHGAFDEVIYQDHWIPTAPWCMQAPWKHWGDEMREDIYVRLSPLCCLMLMCPAGFHGFWKGAGKCCE